MERITEDNRVRLIDGPKQGVVRNFEHLILNSVGGIIFLADQDDQWLPGRISSALEEHYSGALLVLCNAKLVDVEKRFLGSTLFDVLPPSRTFWRNFLLNRFVGACMSFDRCLLQDILPFGHIPMHDQWIGLVGIFHKKISFIETPMLLYRRHKGTQTKLVFSQSKFFSLQPYKYRLMLIQRLIIFLTNKNPLG